MPRGRDAMRAALVSIDVRQPECDMRAAGVRVVVLRAHGLRSPAVPTDVRDADVRVTKCFELCAGAYDNH